MNVRIFAIVLLFAASAVAGPVTRPTTEPVASAHKAPATAPSAQSAKFPTPTELMAKIKAQRKAQDALIKVAFFDLDRPISERPSDFSLFMNADTTSLRSIVDRIHMARDDAAIRAVLVTISPDAQMGLAQAQEIRDALRGVRDAGKKVFVYADAYDTVSYTLASEATNICMMEGGEIEIPGVGFETMFYKGIFDKLGVDPEYIQIGEYKGAEEPYTRTGPSDQLRGQLNKLANGFYDEIVSGISMGRGLSQQQVQQMIDETHLNGIAAKQRGFVDHLVDEDSLRPLITSELGGKINLIDDYGEPPRDDIDFSNPFALFAAMAKRPAPNGRPALALVYADGVIVDGEGGQSLFSSENEVGSESMRRALRAAGRDSTVKAVVLRINSPGGSALASEVMWQAVRSVAKTKPVIVSVGGMAASGGYYLACSGDTIFADPAAIVGSIGVVGGKFVTKDLFAKIGLGTEIFKEGRNAGLYSSTEPWDDRQKRLVRTWMQETYDLFTKRVMQCRKDKIADIDKVARGRIFTAEQAKEKGMIDQIGGIEDAIDFAANKVKLTPGQYDVRIYPEPRTLADFLTGGDPEAKSPLSPSIEISPDSILRAMSPEVSALVGQQLEMVKLLQHRPYMLMSPYIMTTN